MYQWRGRARVLNKSDEIRAFFCQPSKLDTYTVWTVITCNISWTKLFIILQEARLPWASTNDLGRKILYVTTVCSV